MLMLKNVHIGSPFKAYFLKKEALQLFNLADKDPKSYILKIRPYELTNHEWLNYINFIFEKYLSDKSSVYCVKLELLFKDAKFSDYFATTIYSFFHTLKTYYDLLSSSNAIRLTVSHANKQKVFVLIRQ